jgi:hypothetical protein
VADGGPVVHRLLGEEAMLISGHSPDPHDVPLSMPPLDGASRAVTAAAPQLAGIPKYSRVDEPGTDDDYVARLTTATAAAQRSGAVFQRHVNGRDACRGRWCPACISQADVSRGSHPAIVPRRRSTGESESAWRTGGQTVGRPTISLRDGIPCLT